MIETIVENILRLLMNVMSSFEDELKIFLHDIDTREISINGKMI